MPGGAYRDRMFPAAEVRRILRQAAELDEAAREPGASGRGHTLEEIERIAHDAGISEAALQRAVAGETAPVRAPGRTFLPVPSPAFAAVERTVRGELVAARHDELVTAMRSAVGVLGEARSSGDALHWSSAGTGGRRVYAVVEPAAGGRVTVRAEEDLRAVRGGIFSGTLALTLLLCFPLLALLARVPNGVPAVLLGWLVVAYAVAWIRYGRRFARREAQLHALVASVVGVVGGRTAPGGVIDAEGTEPRVRIAGREDALAAADEDAGDERSAGPRNARG